MHLSTWVYGNMTRFWIIGGYEFGSLCAMIYYCVDGVCIAIFASIWEICRVLAIV